MLGLGVGAGIALDAELRQYRVFRTEKAHSEQDEIGLQDLIRTGHSLRDKCALLVLGPFDVIDMHLFDVAIVIADELLAGGEIDSWIGAEARRGFFLAVVELIDFGPLWPRIVGLPAVGWPR